MASNYSAQMYEVMHASFDPGDIDWYRARAKVADGPVLELGAGTGRTLLPIARDGVVIDGLELDAGMRDFLQAKLARESDAVHQRVRVIAGDMRDFQVGTTYALITIPYRAFLHNTTEADRAACLQCCMEHLQPGGMLAMNVFHPSLTFMSHNRGEREGIWRWREEQPHPDGGFVCLTDATKYDSIRQIVHARLRYDHYDEAGRLLNTFMQRLEIAYLYPGDVHAILQRAGFIDITIEGGFEGKPLDDDGSEMAITARKPAS